MGIAPTHQTLRHEILYYPQNELEPVQPDALSELLVARSGRHEGVDPLYDHAGTGATVGFALFDHL